MTIKDFILDLFFPKKCVGCGQEGSWFCQKCFGKIIFVKSPTCPSCNKLTSMGQYCSRCRPRTSLTGVITAAYFKEGPLREAIHNFKYNKIRDLARPLADILGQRLSEGFPSGRLGLFSVPLHPTRLSERGFNQAEEIAKLIAADFGIDIVPGLVRHRATDTQIKKERLKRIKNVIGSFRFEGDKNDIKNKTVLIVDDVFTTGATLSECAKVLREAGARQVWGLVLAKA